MDATRLKQETPKDQAAALRQLAMRPTESAANGATVDLSRDLNRTQAASLVLLAQLARHKGVAA